MGFTKQGTENLKLCAENSTSLWVCIHNLILKKAKYLLVSLVATVQEEIQYSNNPFQLVFSICVLFS